MKLYLKLIFRGRRCSLLAPGLFSLGGVGTAASASGMNRKEKSRNLVKALRNAEPEP